MLNPKVLHVIDSGGLYGAEVMLLTLAAEQQRMGLQPCIASIGEKKQGEKAIEAEAIRRGIPIRKFRMAPGPNWIGAGAILRFAWENRFQLLHSHGYKGNILLGWIPRSIRRLPLITTLHGWTSAPGGDLKMRVYEWLDARTLSRMERVVLVNRAMLRHPKIRKKSSRLFQVIDNGIALNPPPAHWAENEIVLRFCKFPFVIGAIGRLSAEKGFHFLIEAFAEWIRRGANARLVIIGEGGQRSRLEHQIRALGLADKVLLPGFLPNADAYIPHFNVLAMPSLTEGLPITLLEAMRAGTPVLASRVGGIPDVLTHNSTGLLVNIGDISAIVENLIRLGEDDDLMQRIADNARRHFMRRYTSERMAGHYQALYHRVLTRFHPRFFSLPHFSKSQIPD